MSALILTRAEAEAIAMRFDYTLDGAGLPVDADTSAPESCHRVLRWLSLEAAIRDGGGWWGDNNPERLVALHRFRGESCPETFTMDADGAAAIAELLPTWLATAGDCTSDHPEDIALHEERRAALEGLDARVSAGDGPGAPRDLATSFEVVVDVEPRKPFFSVNRLADHLGISTRTIREMVSDGRLPSYKFEGSRRIASADVDAYVAASLDTRKGRS